jgi:XTP/dITP diphosphohydrolase
MRIIVATSNQGKIREIGSILKGFEVLSLKDIGFKQDIPETGVTFSENAFIKAETVYRLFHDRYPDAFFLADDSGLEVDALGGKPGIFSARYAGENSTQQMLIDKLLDEMKNVPPLKRQARFVCHMALITPSNEKQDARGECAGKISDKPAGTNGFGYDPVFLVEEYKFEKTMAELPEEIKNGLSHRRKALNAVRLILERLQEE